MDGKCSLINSTYYAKLYPQNGERIVTTDYVTSLHDEDFVRTGRRTDRETDRQTDRPGPDGRPGVQLVWGHPSKKVSK